MNSAVLYKDDIKGMLNKSNMHKTTYCVYNHIKDIILNNNNAKSRTILYLKVYIKCHYKDI